MKQNNVKHVSIVSLS